MNFNKCLIVLVILWGSGAYAEDQKTVRKPLSEITVANLGLGITIDGYKKINPKAVFKRVDKDGLFHHHEFSMEETKGQDKTKLVLQADQSGHIYWIRYTRFYPTPVLWNDIERPLEETYGKPIGRAIEKNIVLICWHGCVLYPSSQVAAFSPELLRIYDRVPQFYVAIYGDSVQTIKEFSELGIRDRLPNGWLEYNLVDGARQTDMEEDYESRLIGRESKKVDVSPN